MKLSNKAKVILCSILVILPLHAYSAVGSIDYEINNALISMHNYVAAIKLYVTYILFAIAGIVAIIGAFEIYVKMQTGEGEVSKSILQLLGACIFLIASVSLIPAIFGYSFS